MSFVAANNLKCQNFSRIDEKQKVEKQKVIKLKCSVCAINYLPHISSSRIENEINQICERLRDTFIKEMREYKEHSKDSTKTETELKDEYYNLLNKYTYDNLAKEHSCETENCIKSIDSLKIPFLSCTNIECVNEIIRRVRNSHNVNTECTTFLPWWET